MSLPAQSQEAPDVQIIVHPPDEKSDTSGTMSVRALSRTASFDRTRPGLPLASGASGVSLGRLYKVSSTEGTMLGSTNNTTSTLNGSSPSFSGATYEPAVPIPASGVQRNDRKRIIRKPNTEVYIEPGEASFDYPRRDDDWQPYVHPDGSLYFFDPERRIYTDADLSVDLELETINHYAERLLQKAKEMVGFPSATCVLVLERIGKAGCGYYFVEQKKRYVLWLERIPIDMVTRNLPRVQSKAHIKYVMEAEYWTHCMHFPDKWSVTSEVVAELNKMVLHAIADSVVSTTSVIPFDKEELRTILDLIDGLKDSIESFYPHASCIVARFMQDFAEAKFFNFYGQPGVRLNSDQSIFHKPKPRRTLFIKILSLCLFWAPCDYAKELDGIWVDKMINRIMWKQFITNLSNDWSSLALSATVILNANIAFLTLGDDNLVAKSFSFVSTVTSVGVVLIGLILVRQSQRKDQDSAEQADKFLGTVTLPVLETELLAVVFSLPYALLMWSMVWFIIAFACMVFGSAQPATQSTFGVALVFMCLVVSGTAWLTRLTEE